MGITQDVDDILVRLMQGEDQAKRKIAWQKWYIKDSPELIKFVFRRINNHSLCEEIVHETFVIAFENISVKLKQSKKESDEKPNQKCYEYRGTPLLAYLYGIAKNLIKRRFSDRLIISLTAPNGKELIVGQQEDINSPVNCHEIKQRLLEMTQLSPQQKRILILRFLEEKSMKEVATELEITDSFVGVETFRAKKKLRMLLGVYYTNH